MQGSIAPALAIAAPDAYKQRVKRQGIVNAWQSRTLAELSKQPVAKTSLWVGSRRTSA